MGKKLRVPAWVQTVEHINGKIGRDYDYTIVSEVYVKHDLFSDIRTYGIKPSTAERKLRELRVKYRNEFPFRRQPVIIRKTYTWMFPVNFYNWLLSQLNEWKLSLQTPE